MTHELHALVRATYNNAMLTQRDTTAAFERAVDALLGRRPLLSTEEARQEVARMLSVEPPGDAEAGVPESSAERA
jgi:hypothetical protein